MGTLSERGRDALVRRQKRAAGVSVTYAPLSGGSVTLTAVPGAIAFRSETDGGARVEVGDRDYLIDVADLAAVPQIGDRITETINGTACVFEVQTPDTGEPAWRYSSSWRAFYRIHTKRVG